MVPDSLPTTSSQPVLTLAATSGLAAARSSSRSCTRVSTVASPGASRNVTVSSESKAGPSLPSGPTKPQRNTMRWPGTSSASSQSNPPTCHPAHACQIRKRPPGRSSTSARVTVKGPGAIHWASSSGSSHAR